MAKKMICEVYATYGFGDGICVGCGADENVKFCHLHLTNHCDSCLRADFDADRSGCMRCLYAEHCTIPFEYSDVFDD